MGFQQGSPSRSEGVRGTGLRLGLASIADGIPELGQRRTTHSPQRGSLGSAIR